MLPVFCGEKKLIVWPTFILSTSQHLLFVHNDKSVPIHSGSGPYYGISWDHNLIYVAHRKGIDGLGPEISIFDNNLKRVGSYLGDFNDVHQILFVDKFKSLFVTATGYNSILKLEGEEQTFYNWTGTDDDVNHINSIWFDGEDFWFCYHSISKMWQHNTHSKVVKVSPGLTEILLEFNIGKGIHNVYFDGERLFVCNSTNECLSIYNSVLNEVENVHIGNWVRGLSFTKDYLLVGASTLAERKNRMFGDSEVSILDRNTLEILDKKRFLNCGALMGIRVVSELDNAHNGIEFPANH